MINKRLSERQKLDTKGMTTLSIDDAQAFQFAILQGMGITQKAQSITPYGICSNPPDNSLAITFNIQGIASNKVAFIDDPNNRKKGLLKGEIVLINYLTKAMVYVKEDGGIDIETPSGSKIQLLPDGTITLTGDTTINGNLTVTGDISNNGDVISAGAVTATGTVTGGELAVPGSPNYSDHKHSGVETGSGTSGGPV